MNLTGSCVDISNGVYLVSAKSSGVQHPIHVQKLIVANKTPRVFCEGKQCEFQKIISGVSGNPSYECKHLQAVSFLSPPGLICLNETALDT